MNSTQRTNNKGFSFVTFLIVLMCISFLGLLIYLKFDAIKLVIFGDSSENQASELLLGQELNITGNLTETNDILHYSHVVDHADYQKIYLKSANYNLFDYTGKYLINGILVEFYSDFPVIEVQSLVKVTEEKEFEGETEGVDVNEQTGGLTESGSFYNNKIYNFPVMGIWFDEKFSNTYNLAEEKDMSVIFQRTGEEKGFVLDAFYCSKSIEDKNCQKLTDTFENSAEKTFINEIGLKFYKLSEVKSWYFTDKEKGYFFKNMESDSIEGIANHLFINNDWYIKNVLLSKVEEYCADHQVVLDNYHTYKVTSKEGKKIVDILYNDRDTGKVNCKLELEGATVLTKSFTYGEHEESWRVGTSSDLEEKDKKLEKSEKEVGILKEEEKKAEEKKLEHNDEISEVDDFDISVAQIPLKPSKSLTFNSARGHKIVFPSPNIAYSETTSSENLEQVGVHCFAQLNVIQYLQQDNVDKTPDVQIYECTIKNTFDDSPKNLIYKKLGDRHFIIKINNPAWYNFSKNIDIEKR